MKWPRFLILGILATMTVVPSVQAQSEPLFASEKISSYVVEAAINRGDDFVVTERIAYDFGTEERHGIYRYIPRYFVIGYRKIDSGFYLLNIFRDGKTEPFKRSQKSEQDIIQIGDPEQLVQGKHLYQMVYGLTRLIVDTPRGQRLSWNAVGDGSNMPVEQARFQLDAPVTPLEVACFTGERGERGKNCTISTSGTQVIATLTQPLAQYESLTVDVLYPSGTFIPAAIEESRRFPWLAPWMIFATLFSGAWMLVWFIFGRDTKGRGTIIPEYDPPVGLKPYLVNALASDGLNHRALAATILDLSRRGCLRLTILGEGEDFRLHRLRNKEADLDAFEKAIVEMLFLHGDELNLFVSDTKTAKLYQNAQAQVNKSLQTLGLHQWNVDHARVLAGVTVWVSWVACFVVGILFFYDPHFILSALGLVIGNIISYNMPKRTRAGALVYEHIQGFKRYVHVAEKDRLAFHEAPARTPERFSKLLPYAVALGVEKAWGKIFAGITLDPGSDHSALLSATQASAFAHSFSSQARSFAISSSSGGGSGGSAGGGAGGGGVGSW